MLDEKEKNKQRKALKIIHNGILTDVIFKRVTNWTEFYIKQGFSPTDAAAKVMPVPMDYAAAKALLDAEKQQLEDKLNAKVQTIEVKAEVVSSVDTKETPVGNGAGHDTPAVSVHEKIYADPLFQAKEQAQQMKLQLAKSEDLQRNVQEKGKRDETGIFNEGEYGLPVVSTWKAFHYWFQKKAIKEAVSKILGFDISQCKGFAELKAMYDDPNTVRNPVRGLLIMSGTGTGKTYILGGVFHILWHLNYHEGKTWSHIPYLYIGKSTILEQVGGVFKKTYLINPLNDVEVINIEQLRANAGQLWLKKELKMVNNEPVDMWKWKPNINPCVIGFDESQGAKNKGSTQSQIIYAYNDLPQNTVLISVSATPFARVSEAQAFAVSTRRPLEHLGFPKGTYLNNQNWPMYAALIANPAKPTDYVPAAIERLMKDLDHWIVRVRGVKPQYGAQNSVRVIAFESEEKRMFYQQAWERFLMEKAKLEAVKDAGGDTGNNMLVILLKFSMAAEMCHAEHIADKMYTCVNTKVKIKLKDDLLWETTRAAVAALKFKGTIIEIVQILNKKYGVPRDKISLVWGGGQTQLTKKQKAKNKIKDLKDKFEAMGLTADEMIEDLGLDEVEDRVLQELPAHLRLGQQTPEDRQREIVAFQSGKTDYCLYTFKAGGVGLSLHHTDEYVPEDKKCRRKPSGYAVEEDIPNIPVKPRKNHVALTYNAIELVQGVGRCPRLTSLSPTEQEVYAYAGTVEMDIGAIVSKKLKCLTSVVKMHEDWQDIIMHGNNNTERAAKVKEAMATTDGIQEDEGGLIDEAEGDDDE